DKELANKSRLNLMGGITFQHTSFDVLQAAATDMGEESLGNESLQFGGLFTANNSLITRSIMSYLGRVNYNLFDKYLFTASLRADGSSQFCEDNWLSQLPAAAAAWKNNAEDFLNDAAKLDMLKVRLGYGITGNQDVPALSRPALLNKSYDNFNTQSA